MDSAFCQLVPKGFWLLDSLQDCRKVGIILAHMEGSIPEPAFSSQIVCNDYLKITAPGLPDDIQKLSFQESFLHIKQLKGIFSKPQLCKAEPISGRGKLEF